MSDRIRIEIATQQIEFARRYTKSLLVDLTPDDWFYAPSGAATHIAWQIGHLAMAQYALTMLRIRGKEPEDAQWITNDFFRLFQKGTTPQLDPAAYPSVDEICHVWDGVHARALEELSRYSDMELEVKLPEPHAVFDTKLGSIIFCSAHEMLHAGQIGLLRRLMGKPPLR